MSYDLDPLWLHNKIISTIRQQLQLQLCCAQVNEDIITRPESCQQPYTLNYDIMRKFCDIINGRTNSTVWCLDPAVATHALQNEKDQALQCMKDCPLGAHTVCLPMSTATASGLLHWRLLVIQRPGAAPAELFCSIQRASGRVSVIGRAWDGHDLSFAFYQPFLVYVNCEIQAPHHLLCPSFTHTRSLAHRL